MRTVEGDPLDIALTTNGHLLADMAHPLADAGLSRVTVSMDAVDSERFARITRVPNGYEQVLAGVRAAQRAGLSPVKINCVLLRGFNEDQITAFGRFAREEGVVVRFIEFMPLEEDRVWSPEIVVTLDEILRAHGRIHAAARSRSPGAAKPRGATSSKTVLERSASSRPCRIPSADNAAACASRPTARFVPACSPSASTILPL